MRPDRAVQSAGMLGVAGNVNDLAGEEAFEQPVLVQYDGLLPHGQLIRERGLAGGHLAAEEDQLGHGPPIRH